MYRMAYLITTSVLYKTYFVTLKWTTVCLAIHPFRLSFVPTSYRFTVHRPKFLQNYIGCIVFLGNMTRHNIIHATNYLARFIQKTLRDDWTGAKHVLQYLRGTHKLDIYCNRDGSEAIECYADSNLAQEIPDRKSATGSLLLLIGDPIVGNATNRASQLRFHQTQNKLTYHLLLEKLFGYSTSSSRFNWIETVY